VSKVRAMELSCPVCRAELVLEAPEEGMVIECEACRAVVELVSLEPPELLLVEGGEGLTVECPRCGLVFQSYDEGYAICPDCGHRFALDAEENPEEEWE